jgi:L-aspartate oxidase
LLRDANGERFVDELLPRDQVSRAETSRMIDQNVDHLWLDATALEDFEQRFPTIAGELRSVGLDPAKDWLPIAPAAHYLCGGVLADLDGAATLEGLWTAGEAACSGVHGANRLASNSLLEGMVFAFRVVEAIERGKRAADPTGAMRAFLETDEPSAIRGQSVPAASGERGRSALTAEPMASFAPDSATCQQLRQRLQRTMTTDAGVLRSAESTRRAAGTVAELAAIVSAMPYGDRDLAELRNLIDLGAGLLRAASAREESRGAHTRSDFPSRNDGRFRTRLVLAGEHRQAGEQ